MGVVKKNSLALLYVVYPKKFALDAHIATLLKKKLISCANVVEGMSSHYVWKGQLEQANETIVIFKALNSVKKNLISEIERKHPYDVPFIGEISLKSLNKSYLAFAVEQQAK
jgi:periplasmic divalent cation tolerance protein